MNHIEQAKNLLKRTQKALAAINARDKEGLTEDEVLFRLDGLEAMLIMANNDIGRMVRRWEDDAEQEKLLCPDCGEPWPKTETILADGSLGCPCRERRELGLDNEMNL